MIDYDLVNVREVFGKIFVLAVNNKINLAAFENMLVKSNFVKSIEQNEYDNIFYDSLEKIFVSITSKSVNDTSYGVYNDAYWAGVSYFDLHYKLNKSFSYLFLKVPIEKMLNLYPVYHEMDFSSLLEEFEHIANQKTILQLLCKRKGVLLPKVAKSIGVSASTLVKYMYSDNSLYKASFQTAIKLVNYFEVPVNLFVE